jgi:hypothetical protein
MQRSTEYYVRSIQSFDGWVCARWGKETTRGGRTTYVLGNTTYVVQYKSTPVLSERREALFRPAHGVYSRSPVRGRFQGTHHMYSSFIRSFCEGQSGKRETSSGKSDALEWICVCLGVDGNERERTTWDWEALGTCWRSSFLEWFDGFSLTPFRRGCSAQP